MTVEWLAVGRVTHDGFRVRGEVDGASVRLVVSTAENLSSPTFFGPVTPDARGDHDIATLDATGLDPETEYWFAFEVDDTIDTDWKGSVPKTAAAPGDPESFSFWSFSCAGGSNAEASTTDNVSNRASFADILARDPDFGIHTGDFHYRDITSSDLAPHRAVYGDVLTFNGDEGADALQGRLYRLVPLVLGVDDHEFGPNDSDATSSGRLQFQQAYREMVPSYDLPATEPSATEGQGGIWHSFVRGRVRFVVTDTRTERSPKGDTDNADKVTMGAEQEAWFFAELLAAKTAGQAICWVNTYPWIAAASTGADHWGGYTTHRQKIADFIDEHDLGPLMFIVSGDMHALAIDDGRNNDWGGFPVFQFASMDASGSSKGGPYWKGPSQGRDRYGIVEVVDSGGDTLSVTGTGWIADSVWDSHTFDIALPAPAAAAIAWRINGVDRTVTKVLVGGEERTIAAVRVPT